MRRLPRHIAQSLKHAWDLEPLLHGSTGRKHIHYYGNTATFSKSCKNVITEHYMAGFPSTQLIH